MRTVDFKLGYSQLYSTFQNKSDYFTALVLV